jgi:thymidylate synthase
VTEGARDSFSIFSWSHEQSRIEGYRHHPKIAFTIAV